MTDITSGGPEYSWDVRPSRVLKHERKSIFFSKKYGVHKYLEIY